VHPSRAPHLMDSPQRKEESTRVSRTGRHRSPCGRPLRRLRIPRRSCARVFALNPILRKITAGLQSECCSLMTLVSHKPKPRSGNESRQTPNQNYFGYPPASRRRSTSLTIRGLPFPPIAFMTWPTKNPNNFSRPERYSATLLSSAAIT
jgi:hypothetical protein